MIYLTNNHLFLDLNKTGLSYGRLYNRTVLNLKNAQKEAFKVFNIVNFTYQTKY